MGDGIDLISMGEALVDFLPNELGKPVHQITQWTPCPGGSPANVAIGLARLGGRAAMVGVIGDDEFGQFLRQSLERDAVDVSHLRQTKEGKTGLVFISLSATGERSFAFYRTRSAELLLSAEDVDVAFLGRARALHCGTNSLLFPHAREATLQSVAAARAAGVLVSCDPNLRLHMWPNPAELRGLLDQLLPQCTMVKLAEDEIEFVTGEKDPARALERLAKAGVALPIVTRAEQGAALMWKDRFIQVAAPVTQAVDSTGAGDGFVAAMIWGLTRLYPDRDALGRAGAGELRELGTFACLVGAKVVEKLGAVAGLPTLDEVRAGLPQMLR